MLGHGTILRGCSGRAELAPGTLGNAPAATRILANVALRSLDVLDGSDAPAVLAPATDPVSMPRPAVPTVGGRVFIRGDSDPEVPVTGTRVPRASRGRDASQAVTALYHAHYSSLVRIVALLVADAAEAEEIVQDAFVSMHRAWRRLGDRDAAIGDLRRTVVTRARSRAAPLDPPGQPASGVSEEVLMAALRGLPARQREALVLRYYTDWPDPQIAAAMGVSGPALNVHIRRGMSVLRARTGRLGGGCGS